MKAKRERAAFKRWMGNLGGHAPGLHNAATRDYLKERSLINNNLRAWKYEQGGYDLELFRTGRSVICGYRVLPIQSSFWVERRAGLFARLYRWIRRVPERDFFNTVDVIHPLCARDAAIVNDEEKTIILTELVWRRMLDLSRENWNQAYQAIQDRLAECGYAEIGAENWLPDTKNQRTVM